MTPRKSISIVGAGVAGLTLAAALDPRRFHVNLVEAQPERFAQGGSLTLWPAARRELQRLGAWDLLADDAEALPRRLALHHLDGRRRVGLRAPTSHLVERGKLLSALADVVGRHVEFRVHEVHAPGQLTGDYVVGADGVRGVVRGLVDPVRVHREPTKYVALRGWAPMPKDCSFGEYWGSGLLFGVLPQGNRAYWFSTWRADDPEPLDPAAMLTRARARFADAAPVITALLRSAEDVIATRLWRAPNLRRYVADRYVVIGDAAHASLPNLGRGACDAIVDAATLARALNAGRDLAWWSLHRRLATQATKAAADRLAEFALGS